MKFLLLFIVLLVFGGALAANLFIDNRSLSSVELENVRTVCQGCHGQVPQYDSASQVHNKHTAFECGFCHSDISGLKTTNNFHFGLEWLGIGVISLALIGIITNVFMANRKGRVN